MKQLHQFIKTNLIEGYQKAHLEKLTIQTKKQTDLVTSRDLFIERYMIDKIKQKFPLDSFISEEFFAQTQLDEKRYWAIDPIDGTLNYANDFALHCCQCALIENTEIIYAIIYIPKLNLVYHAIKGSGAYLNDSLIQPNATNSLSNQLISLLGVSKNGPHKQRFKNMIDFGIKNNMKIRALGSAGVEMALTASSTFSILYTDVSNIWDIAPGLLILKEAGCITKNAKNQEYELLDEELFVFGNQTIYQIAQEEKIFET